MQGSLWLRAGGPEDESPPQKVVDGVLAMLAGAGGPERINRLVKEQQVQAQAADAADVPKRPVRGWWACGLRCQRLGWCNPLGHTSHGLNPPKLLPPLQVFIAFRVREALPQAMGLMRALEAKGVAAFCSSAPGHIPPGADWCAPPPPHPLPPCSSSRSDGLVLPALKLTNYQPAQHLG
jgi:hypothetical protein